MLTPVPLSDCEQARQGVSAQLDGELPELGSARLAAHLRECPACSAYAFEVAAVATRIRSAPLERPAARIQLRHPRRPATRATVVAVAAALLLVAGAVRTSQSGAPGVATTPTVISTGFAADSLLLHRLGAGVSSTDVSSRGGQVTV
jgi:anti-sigma factor RsiW